MDNDESIVTFLARHNLEKYAQKMQDEDVNTVSTLRMLSEAHLQELGVSVGGRVTIAHALRK